MPRQLGKLEGFPRQAGVKFWKGQSRHQQRSDAETRFGDTLARLRTGRALPLQLADPSPQLELVDTLVVSALPQALGPARPSVGDF